MRIGIVNIGDELLSGKILNTNQFELSRLLASLGHEIVFAIVVGDHAKNLAGALEWITGGTQYRSEQVRVEVLVLTGGLGPTRDDLTREAVAAFLNKKVIESADALNWLGAFLGKTMDEIPPGQRIQATIPESTIPLRNPTGTACGFKTTYRGISLFAFPGVPSELKAMATLHLLPAIPSRQQLLERSLWVFGWSEGSQRQAFGSVNIHPPFQFSSLPNEKGVKLSLSCLIATEEREDRQVELDGIWKALVAAIPSEAVVDAHGADLVEIVQRQLLAERAQVSVAESCTGGGLAALLTDLPGSSAIFQKGFLTYSNAAKSEMLGVDPELLNTHGAVSEACALAMVKGCLIRSNAQYACAITGIAGPDGGTSEKPVGTVWIAVASQKAALAHKFQFRGDRRTVRSRSCYSALNLLRLHISENSA